MLVLTSGMVRNFLLGVQSIENKSVDLDLKRKHFPSIPYSEIPYFLSMILYVGTMQAVLGLRYRRFHFNHYLCYGQGGTRL